MIQEMGKLIDDRNTRYGDRERFAEWFAMKYGYLKTREQRQTGKQRVVRRHHAQH